MSMSLKQPLKIYATINKQNPGYDKFEPNIVLVNKLNPGYDK